MSALDDLIAQVGDPALRSRLEEEARRVQAGRKFGLVFEEHLPDDTLLPGVPVRRGGLAARRGDAGGRLLRVLRVSGGKALCADASASVTGEGCAAVEIPLGELVAAARPGEPVYPFLAEMDRIGRGGPDAPWHALIEADNAHALQFLQYVCGGKVDCIYVDPPYNTGARDWKYNNDYVDQNDAWRHSKWLSMMKRRLRLAKKLLNPKDSVLIVTIDEKEYLHLGCLLEEMFPEARIQMVSSVINSAGSDKKEWFSRTNEFLFILMFGEAQPLALSLGDEWRGNVNVDKSVPALYWNQLMRSGSSPLRANHPLTFYPLFISEDGKKIVKFGEPLPLETDRHSIEAEPGTKVVWPIRSTGEEGRWQLGRERLMAAYEKGYVRLGRFTDKGMAITYLAQGEQDKIASGKFRIVGHRDDGSVIETANNYTHQFVPGSQWDVPSHNATYHGAQLLNKILGKRFDFPKSLYAVHDILRFFVADKPDALIVDFFAGSGTTLHAVNLLNAEDGGQRRCIMVTNNEVSEAEARALLERGMKPGDEEWEALGIARHVTWPRTRCSIEGRNIRGDALTGNYGVEVEDYEEDGECTVVSRATGRPVRGKRYKKAKRQLYPKLAELAMADGFQANAAFYRLSFLDKDSVALGKALEALLPTLWMKAGAQGAPPGGGEGDGNTRLEAASPRGGEAPILSVLRDGAAGSRTSGSGDAGLPEVRHPAAPLREESARTEAGQCGVLVFPENRFAVLTDERAMPRLKEAVGVGWTAFLTTDDSGAFRAMASELGPGVRCVQLYRDYLDNFRINRERE